MIEDMVYHNENLQCIPQAKQYLGCAHSTTVDHTQLLLSYKFLLASMEPTLAGIEAPAGGGFLFLKSSEIYSMVTNSTPSCFRKCSMSLESVEHIFGNDSGLGGIAVFTHLSCIKITCGRPETSGWHEMGKTNSSYSR